MRPSSSLRSTWPWKVGSVAVLVRPGRGRPGGPDPARARPARRRSRSSRAAPASSSPRRSRPRRPDGWDRARTRAAPVPGRRRARRRTSSARPAASRRSRGSATSNVVAPVSSAPKARPLPRARGRRPRRGPRAWPATSGRGRAGRVTRVRIPSGPRTSTTGGDARSAGAAMNASVRSSAGSGETTTFSARTGSAYGIRRSEALPETSTSSRPCTSSTGASAVSVTVTARRSPGASVSPRADGDRRVAVHVHVGRLRGDVGECQRLRALHALLGPREPERERSRVGDDRRVGRGRDVEPAGAALQRRRGERLARARQRGADGRGRPSGCSWRSSAAAPATCGAAMLVPLKRATPGGGSKPGRSSGSRRPVPRGRAWWRTSPSGRAS